MNAPVDALSQEAARYGQRADRWKDMSERDRQLHRLIRPLRAALYKVDYPLSHIEGMIESFTDGARVMGGALQLEPDFQRGHVWTRDKQVGYIENLFRGVAPTVLRFNCPAWNGDRKIASDMNTGDIVCVDGLQRLTAVRQFMAGEFPVFGDKFVDDFAGTDFDPKRINYRLSIEVFDIAWRADLLQFYLDINTGGVVHSDDEIARVRSLLADQQQPSAPQPSSAGKPRRPSA